MSKSLKVAIVADWLTNVGGAEHLVYSLHNAFPEAPIFTSVFDAQRCHLFKGLDVRTSSLQRLPSFLRWRHQLFPLLRAAAFRKLDLSAYDVVISSASAEAKAVQVRPDAVHICYCHTPTRYYWSHYEEYKKHPGFGILNPLARLALPLFVRKMRRLDLQAVAGVDYFIANSHEVQERIEKYYHRESTVIFPPVGTKRLKPAASTKKEDFYLIVGRQIPYKRVDLAIAACNKLGRRLTVIGKGSEHGKLVKLAGPSVEFLTGITDVQKIAYFQKAKAFIFPSLEDFGIVPVEAMAAGTPVIAYQLGGAADTVKPGVSGLFFQEQTVEAVAEAIQQFEAQTFDRQAIIAHAQQFDESVFIEKMQQFVNEHQEPRNPEPAH
ncbi:MAG TPA: glycosyltransferase [Candidatus Acidoferrum sp.]|nr:glycosyltransferase [Candidatus Acidoferrum sp.]